MTGRDTDLPPASNPPSCTGREAASGPPEWDPEFAAELIGAIVLVGITQIDENETVVDKFQIWGIVESAVPNDSINIELHGEHAGATWRCPPDLEAFQPAPPGTYTLHSTGEQIVDPDFTTAWTIHNSSRQSERP